MNKNKSIFDWDAALAASANIANSLKGYGRTDYTPEEMAAVPRSHVCLIEGDDSSFDDEVFHEKKGYRR